MKKLTNFMTKMKQKAKEVISKEYFIYTGVFFFIMVSLYLAMIFAGMASTPKFTYAEF